MSVTEEENILISNNKPVYGLATYTELGKS